MKRNYIDNILIGCCFFLLTIGCGSKHKELHAVSHETSVDSNLEHLLQPVNEQVVASIPVIQAEQGLQVFEVQAQGIVQYDSRQQTAISSRVSGRIEKMMIKYNYQPVQKGQVIMEIYSPDLVAAQRELLLIQQSDANNNTLLQRAKERLSLLGMSASQINNVLVTKEPIYRVPVYSNVNGYILETASIGTNYSTPAVATSESNITAGGMNDGMNSSSSSQNKTTTVSSPLSMLREGQYVNAGQSLFTVYQKGGLIAEFALTPSLAALLQKGQRVLFSGKNNDNMYTGNIGLIQPVQRNGENFTLARVYIHDSQLSAGELLTAYIPIVTQKGYWLPKEAVVQLGSDNVVFKQQGKVFIPEKVITGIVANDNIQILTDISSWNIASNARYMVDSESFIKVK